MILSKSSQYALRALIFIAEKDLTTQKKYTIKEISQHVSAPPAFIAKIINKLTASGFVASRKGPNGGLYSNKETYNCTVNDVIELFDGKDFHTKCMLGLNQCSDINPCPIHSDYKLISKKYSQLVKQTKIGYLALNLNKTELGFRIGLSK